MSRVLIAETPLGREILVATRMSGQEELGRLPEFQLEFRSPKGDIKPKDILGKNISWAIELDANKARYFNGFVTHFAEAGETTTAEHEKGRKGTSYIYHATVHPWLWFLTRASNCRIFQKKSAVEIADAVFAEYGFADVKKLLTSKYPKRDFNVQYRETDFNFVCRLFEQEGIYFAFEYDNGKNTLVLMDSLGAHQSRTSTLAGASPLKVPFHSASQAPAKTDHITSWSVNREIQPGKYTIDDFDYLKPRLKMSGDGIETAPHDLAEFEIYDYPGEYDTPADGAQYAKTRIEELHARYEQFAGSGNLRLAAPGLVIKLEEHSRPGYNDEYLVTSVSYTASAGGLSSGGGDGGDFHCSLSAIGGKTAFRPARVTPKPIIQGPQTAIVVGPSGEEIWTDEHGRIKVEFHWDRYSKTDDNSSCWVRVAQPLAGKGWGFLALPRIGHEVIVEFLEGDPDDPIVTGSVYNGELKPPYDLPKEKTRSGLKTLSSKNGSTDNFNELRFEDDKGNEQIYIQAEKDKHIRIKNDRLEWVGNESHLQVKADDFEWLDKDHHVKVSHDRNEKIGNVLSLDIGKDLQGKMGTKLCLDAGKEIHLKAGSTLVLESGTTLTLKVGSNHVTINSSGVSIKGTKIDMKADGNVNIDGAMTQINSSAASPASPADGSGASPQPATDAKEAGTSTGGEMSEPEPRQAPTAYSPQAQMFKMAANGGTPFCEICNC